jgi:hypothetical protein
MTINRHCLLVASLPALIMATDASGAGTKGFWDGVWTGAEGRIKTAPISISIAHNEVVAYTIGGAPFDIQYSRVTPTSVSFGDRDHYFVELDKTGEASAMGRIHGRIGDGSVSLTKQ